MSGEQLRVEWGIHAPRTVVRSSAPIRHSPSSRAYPRDIANKQRVRMRQLGGHVEDRVNELYATCFRDSGNSFPDDFFLPNNTKQTLLLANRS